MINHPHMKVFMLYFGTFILLGVIITALGPLFPYLAAVEDHIETDYSFLFLCRAAGYISGSLLIKALQKHFTLHRLAAASVFLNVFALPLTHTSSLALKGVFVFVFSIGNSWTDITINVSIIETFKPKEVDSWLQVCHGAFGIGGLLGPYIVYLLEANTYFILGFCGLILCPFFFFFLSPETKEHKELYQSLNKEEKEEKGREMGQREVFIICIMYWLIIGQECSFSGWIPSFAVMNGYSTKEHATMYSSLYWIAVTAFRFIFPLIKGKASTKLLALYFLATVSSLVSLGIINVGYHQLGIVLGALLLGVANSVVFPLTLTMPQEYGYKVSTSEGSSFMLAGAIGEGTLTVLIGLLMTLTTTDSLFYGMCLLNAFLFFSVKGLMKDFSAHSSEPKQEGIEMENF